ncbi:2'-5' RNA ligase [Paenibacillus sp. V4I9]|uniref:2'-5' RNA ligase family protein n=1 Tax=Paenibacillus sp. V4I9 TaxID=3042308 RepID=UPI00278A5766|nr:2'-5' RNA ligase family protein [Paenibacillus sp. V4I9]MDQ0891265.1 2'-5' RNA ligase [Paenibacillus sp. V4I9]
MESNKNPFAVDSYIVLDIPEDIAQKVMNIRKHNKDQFRLSLPVEITITGSSGIGVIDHNEDPEKVFNIVGEIAASIPPIRATFGNVIRFPYTDIFVLTLKDEGPFKKFQKRLADSGIRFKENPFPYKPHCTLRGRSPVTEEEAEQLYKVSITEEFYLNTFSIYSLGTDNEKVNLERLQFGKLLGKKSKLF